MAARDAQNPKNPANDPEMGPLGPGHAPANDPMKGIRGVMAATMILEGIVLLLALTVVSRVSGGLGPEWLQITYVAVVAVLMFIAAFMQKAKQAKVVNWTLQILAVIGGFANISIAIMGIVFVAVWLYIYHLQKVMEQRLDRGLLPSQHI